MRRNDWARSLQALVTVATVALVPSATLYACSNTDPVLLPPRDSAVDSTATRDANPGLTDAAKDVSSDRDPCAPLQAAQCSPTAQWEAPVAVYSSGGGGFASVTPDELHLAFYEAGGTGDGGTGIVRVADRATASEPFGAGRPLAGPVDGLGVGISADGLLLVATKNGSATLFSRATGTDPFGLPSTESFQFGKEDQYFRAPVFLQSGSFLLTRLQASPGALAYTQIDKVGAVYQQGEVLIPHADLLNTSNGGDLVPRPTGMSKDLRTLFFYDEAKKVERAAFRAGPGCAYTTVVDLGDRPGAQPNADCSALYYAAPGATGSDIVRVARKP